MLMLWTKPNTSTPTTSTLCHARHRSYSRWISLRKEEMRMAITSHSSATLPTWIGQETFHRLSSDQRFWPQAISSGCASRNTTASMAIALWKAKIMSSPNGRSIHFRRAARMNCKATMV